MYVSRCWYKPCSSTSNTLAGCHNGRICNTKTFNQCLNKANAIHYVLTSMQALKELLLLLLKLITSIQVLKELLLLLFKVTSLYNADVLVFRSDWSTPHLNIDCSYLSQYTVSLLLSTRQCFLSMIGSWFSICLLLYGWRLCHPPLTGILVFVHSLVFCLCFVFQMQARPQLQGMQYTTLDCLSKGSISWTQSILSGESVQIWRLLWCLTFYRHTCCLRSFRQHKESPLAVGFHTPGPLQDCWDRYPVCTVQEHHKV